MPAWTLPERQIWQIVLFLRHLPATAGPVAENADWWVPFYPKGNMQRPTGPLCDGCHSVNSDMFPP